MDSWQEPQKPNRLKSFFERKEHTQHSLSSQRTPSRSSASVVQRPGSSEAITEDRQRTISRYFDAAKLLEETVKVIGSRWGSFDFPELNGEPEDFNDSLFSEKICAVMDARKSNISNKTAWRTCRHAVQCAFTAFSPFAKNFLTIAKDPQPVILPFLCFSW